MTGDPYKVLQVDPEAEDEVITAAYRRLAMKYHPDTGGPDSQARMAAINAAWEVLRDPDRRASFDRQRSVQAAMGRAHSPASRSASASAAAEASTSAEPTSPEPAARTPVSREPVPESVSRDWTSGRSAVGGGYDASMRTADGDGAAGPPPGNPSGSVLTFGRYVRWSLGEIARVDLEYIEWLDRMTIGRPYREEIDGILRRAGRRRSTTTEADSRRGLFRRR